MLRTRKRWPLVLFALVAGTSNCSSSTSDSALAAGERASSSGGAATSTGAGTPAIDVSSGGAGTSGSGGGGVGGDNLPPENETTSAFRAPVATDRYIWSANPTSGRVSLIDPQRLSVTTVDAGNGPTYLAPVPGAADADRALVINVLSKDATLLVKPQQQAPFATRIDLSDGCNSWTPNGCNSWAISSDGRWAIAWTNAAELSAPSPSEGCQEISIIDLNASAPHATTVSVGYRPSQIAFAQGRAYAVTSDGVSIVDLASATVLSTIKLDPDSAADPSDVSITPDGAYAVVRVDASREVLVVNLDPAVDPADTERTAYALDDVVTDVDLADTGDRAVAVSRAASQVAVLPVPPPSSVTQDAGAAPDGGVVSGVQTFTLPNAVAGSVEIAPGGLAALLYTNAVPLELLTYVPLDAPETRRSIYVRNAIQSALFTPDGRHAVVLHNTAVEGITSLPEPTPLPDGGGPSDGGSVPDGAAAADSGAAFAAASLPIPDTLVKPTTVARPDTTEVKPVIGAFSLVPLATKNPPAIWPTLSPIMDHGVAMSAAGDHVILAARDDTTRQYYAYVADLPSLQVTKFDLASPPLAVGVVENPPRGFVAQDNPDGRITIIDLEQHTARTLTGFELNANIIEGAATSAEDGGAQ